MSKERDLLERWLKIIVWPDYYPLRDDTKELLAQPESEQSNEPLSDDELPTNNPKINTDGERLAFHAGIRWAEHQHGIGVDNE